MCISTTAAPRSATSGSIAGSRPAVTSLTTIAPASSAARATSALPVSTERTRPGCRRASSPITGTTRAISAAALTGAAPGRVDSPPTSIASAPSATRRSACASAGAGSAKRPPSENESGVMLRIPITAGRPRAHSALTRAAGMRQLYRSLPLGKSRRRAFWYPLRP